MKGTCKFAVVSVHRGHALFPEQQVLSGRFANLNR